MSPHLQCLNNKQNKIRHQLLQAVRSNYYNNKLLLQQQQQQLLLLLQLLQVLETRASDARVLASPRYDHSQGTIH